MHTASGFFESGVPPVPPRPLQDTLPDYGSEVVILDTMFFSPHPETGALKAGRIGKINLKTLTAEVTVQLTVPLENLRRLS